MIDRRNQLLGTLEDISQERKYDLLDAIYCEIFNLAGCVEGNREEDDVTWLARTLWQAHSDEVPGRWEGLADDTKEFWRDIARASLEALPALMGRIASRCRDYSKVLDTLCRAERTEREKRRRARR